MRRLIFLSLVALAVPSLASGQTGEQVSYYHTDGIGSVRMITNEARQVVATYDFLPFGEPLSASSTVPEPRKFAGKERDTETGFDYFGARHYASGNGRFTTVDPGHVGGDIFDPQSWNGYTYARNNPLRFIDPFGFDSCPANTDTSTCVEGRAGIGEFVFDYTQWMLADLFRRYWAWRNQPVEVMGGTPFAPPIFKAASGALAAESRALTLYYPAANGFLGATMRTTLQAGTVIDRYGGAAASRFFSPTGTSLAARSLPPGVAGNGLRSFEVVRPFEVEAGTVTPWFGQIGFGTQYRSSLTLDELLSKGFLREVRP